MDNLDLLIRCLKHVDTHSSEYGCWEWLGADSDGYGVLSHPVTRLHIRVHRLFFEVFKGSIKEGHEICHECDNKKCCNPEHLFQGTHKENMEDYAAKKLLADLLEKFPENHSKRSMSLHCPQGHAYTKVNTRITKKGSRVCKICERKASREYQRKRRKKF